MNYIDYFKIKSEYELTAANIGIHKNDWIKARQSDSKAQAHHVMKINSFDILPIINRDKTVTNYWHTIHWGNFTTICAEKAEITEKYKIYYLTRIKDLIRKFVKDETEYCFLTSIDEIIGLVTISHLNYKSVYLYVYEMIVELEMGLNQLILKEKKDNYDIENVLISINNEKNNSRIHQTLTRFKKDSLKGVDANILEYFSLPELISLFVKFKIHYKLGYNNDKTFLIMVDKIYDIRNVVAHSTKSLVRKRDDVKQVYQLIKNLDNINKRIFKLNNK